MTSKTPTKKTKATGHKAAQAAEKARLSRLLSMAGCISRVAFDRMPFAEKLVAVRTGVRILD